MPAARSTQEKEFLAPVHFFSHGTPSMLGEESASADYWKKCGDEALKNGIKHVVIMGAHWAAINDEIQVAMNPKPTKQPIGSVHPRKYVDYELVPDIPMGKRVIDILRKAGFNANPHPTFEWIHDVYLIIIRMFPNGSPPTTIISTNSRFDPHYHIRIGQALRDLRKEKDVLLIGSGGAVHNLFRNKYKYAFKYADNFAMDGPTGDWALDFRQEFEDAITKNTGPQLCKAMSMLMKLPKYRDAHGTDDHFMPAMFIAGTCSHPQDEGTPVELGAEDWELTNMGNSQYTLGKWPPEIVAA